MSSISRLLTESLASEWDIKDVAAVASADLTQEVVAASSPQATSLSQIFKEQPPLLDEYVRSPQYLGLPRGLGAIQFDLVRHFEQILFPETYLLMAEEWGKEWMPVRYVNELVAEWGKGSGKDLCIQIAFSRVANILLCMHNPQEYYGLAHNTIIHFLNVAYSAPQAHGAFFKPMRNLFVSSPFFKDRFEADLPGPQATSIRLENQLELISGHSDADSLEGKNLLAGVADEVSAFPTQAITRTGKPPARNADVIIDMLRSSASTRFPITHKVAQISFPRTKNGDPIKLAVKEGLDSIAEDGESSIYFVSGPHRTWDVNPIYATMPKITLPGMDYPIPAAPRIVNDYKKKRAFARAKYECDPDDAVNAYFKDRAAIERAFSQPFVIPPLGVHYSFGVDAAAGEVSPSWQANFSLNGLTPIPGAIYAIHADMAVTGDRAGIAMSHIKEWIEVETSEADGTGVRIERRPFVVVDFATAFEADSEALTPAGENVEREIQIRWYRKLVQYLAEYGFPILSVSMDGFQSLDSLQILESRGFEVARVSTDRDDTVWKTLQDVVYEGRLLGPDHALLRTELFALDRRGKKVDHPPGGSKDIADAVAASVSQALILGGQEADLDVDAASLAADMFLTAGPSGFGEFDAFGSFFSGNNDDSFYMTASGSTWPTM